MDRFEATRMFVRVVQTGSFSAAAKSEGTTQSTVSKKIGALEAHLGCQLLMRSSRSLSMTEAGNEYFRRGQAVMENLEVAETAARGRMRVCERRCECPCLLYCRGLSWHR